MKEIKLTQNQVALVDDDMYEELNQWKWFASRNGKLFYALRRMTVSGKRKTILMHHKVIGVPPKGLETDHQNGNGLHNFKSNLRFVTRRQNNQNRINQKSSSKYPGVSWFERDQNWRARIRINGKAKHLGYFSSEIEAFMAYKQANGLLGETVLQLGIL